MDQAASVDLSRTTGLINIAGDLDFSGQTVLVTGGADGIGAGLARALHGLGAHVIALDIQKSKLDALAADLGTRITTLPFDLGVTDPAAYDALAQSIVDSSPIGKVDAYIMNAGVVKLSNGKGVSGVTGDEFRAIAQINAHSHADIFRSLKNKFALAANARIVATLSPIIGRADPVTPGYALSKRMLDTYANNMAGELKGTDAVVSGWVPPPVQNFLRRDLKPGEPVHAHPEGIDIVELPLRLAASAVSKQFNGKVIAIAYDHLRDKSQKTADGVAYDFMPRSADDNGFVYDLRVRDFDANGGDGGAAVTNAYSTGSMRAILGLGRTPDMQADKAISGVYETPEHVAKYRKPEVQPS